MTYEVEIRVTRRPDGRVPDILVHTTHIGTTIEGAWTAIPTLARAVTSELTEQITDVPVLDPEIITELRTLVAACLDGYDDDRAGRLDGALRTLEEPAHG